jgi:hypothetical protein
VRRRRVRADARTGAPVRRAHLIAVERTRSLRRVVLGLHRCLGLDGEHPVWSAGRCRGRLQPAQARPGQPPSAPMRGRGHPAGPAHGMPAGQHGQRQPLARGDGAGLESPRRAVAPAVESWGQHKERSKVCCGCNCGAVEASQCWSLW